MENQANIEPTKVPKFSKNTLILVTSICLTAIFVGGGVFWWQNVRWQNIKNKEVEVVSQELQQQIGNLQDQINQLQKEKDSENEDVDIQESDLETGKQMGYIKSVYEENGKKYLKIDYIQWLQGEEGAEACVEDEGCLPQCLEENSCLPNGYYVRNQNTKIRTFEISDSIMFDFTDLQSTGFELDNIPLTSFTISFAEFKGIFSSSDTEQDWLRNSIYNIELQNGIVIKLWHQYQP